MNILESPHAVKKAYPVRIVTHSGHDDFTFAGTSARLLKTGLKQFFSQICFSENNLIVKTSKPYAFKENSFSFKIN